jgi:alpha-tubulin suppressor-like RCC1 family protein
MKKIFLLAMGSFVLTVNAQCWKDVAVGGDYSLALKTDGTLWAWGKNEGGALGDGTTTNKYSITQIGTDNNWQSISAGSYTSYAIKTDGTLWAWGIGPQGQLGNGQSGSGEVISLIPIQVGTESDWLSVKAATGHAIALKVNGTLWAWGYNFYYQLGDGTMIDKNIPTQIGTSTNWQYINCGSRSSYAIKSDGTLWGWGRNNYGQLGVGDNLDKSEPTQIGTSSDWQSISSSGTSTIALKSNGSLWAWGYNFYYQLGDGTLIDKNIPTQIGNSTNWQSIGTGTSAIKTDGSLWRWGPGSYGFGNGTNSAYSSPTQIGNQTDWKNIASGLSVHYAILKTNNTLWTWGLNSSGQLANCTLTGDGNQGTYFMSPIQVLCTPCLPLSTTEPLLNDFKLYPNPSNGLVMIESKTALKDVQAYNLTGQLLYSSQLNDLNTTVDISSFETGTYFFKIQFENNQSATVKVVRN